MAAIDALADRVASLPRAIEPGRDLWPSLRGQLAGRNRPPLMMPGRSRPRFDVSWRSAAAGVALVAALSAATVALVRRHEPARGDVVMRVLPNETCGSLAPGECSPVPSAVPVADYEAQARTLAAELAARRGQLSPSTVATVERSLRTIDAAIAEARDALDRDPTNPDLAEMLNSSYTHKLSLLRRAAELPAGA
jgi:hypothetical protein